jgi:2-C-methyl-D-erythritol 2,4-cyclodiphosphate synthase
VADSGGSRTGIGFDVHAFDPRRPLRLGGMAFEGEDGLAGHSDGDVVCHALADALLGAAALGDLGDHFPETDPELIGIPGLTLLGRVVELLRERRLVPDAVDATVIAERPSIAPARDEMRRRIAAVLGLGEDRVSVKATRPEGLGLRGEGIGCLAVATIRPG